VKVMPSDRLCGAVKSSPCKREGFSTIRSA
jgi:hypothetical protein